MKVSDSTWDMLVRYSQLSEEQLCGKASDELDPQSWPELKTHQWGNAMTQGSSEKPEFLENIKVHRITQQLYKKRYMRAIN